VVPQRRNLVTQYSVWNHYGKGSLEESSVSAARVVSVPLLAVALLGVSGRASATFSAESYFPLAPGNTWQYNGSPPSVDAVPAFPIPIGGVDTLVLCRCVSAGGVLVGTTDYLTNDSNGLRHHGFTETGISSPLVATFSPPALLLAADFEVGVPMNSQGDLAIEGEAQLPDRN
jgi:hypothetical protein